MTSLIASSTQLLSTPSLSRPRSLLVSKVPEGDWFSSRKQQLKSRNQSVPHDILAKREKNLVDSPLSRCPVEVGYQIRLYLDGVDLFQLSHACHAFLNFYSFKEWYGRYVSRFPSWSCGGLLGNDPDQGCLSSYKKEFTSDAFLRRRLGYPSPLSLSSPLMSLPLSFPLILPLPPSNEPFSTSNVTGSTVEPMDICMPYDSQAPKEVIDDKEYLHEHEQSNIRVKLDEGKYYPSDSETDSGRFNRVASPVYSTDLKSRSTFAGSLVARPSVIDHNNSTLPVGSPTEQLYDFRVLLHATPDLTHPVAVLTSDLWTTNTDGPWSGQFAPRDLPVVQLVELKHFPMYEPTSPGSKRRRSSRLQEMRFLVTLAFGQNVGEQDMLLLDVWRLVKVIEVFIPMSTTAAPGLGSTSLSSSSLSSSWPSSSVAQTHGNVRLGRIETIKISANDDMRCRVVKIYSTVVSIDWAYRIQKELIRVQSASPSVTATSSSASTACSPQTDVDEDHDMSLTENYGYTHDSFEKGTHGNSGIGKSPLGTVKDKMVTVECIAIFGIQNSDTSSAMVARKILFTADRKRKHAQAKTLGDASWEKRVLSRGVSCMTLFPCYSGYERYLVMFNRYGRGMIWDWVEERQVTQLRMESDKGLKDGKIQRPTGQNEGNQSSSEAGPSSGALDSQTQGQAVSATNAGNGGGTAEENAPVANPNRWLSYWGAQVSFTETPDPFEMDVKKGRSFRIVILADGRDDEWESTWWHVDESSLGAMDHTLDQWRFLPTGSKANPQKTDAPVIYAHGKRHEEQTIGVEFISKKRQLEMLSKGQKEMTLATAPLRFNAYVVWNRYRISLTADRGLVMVDLEKKSSKERNDASSKGEQDSEWVTYLENSLGKTLVDIATVNNSLIVTLKDGHLVWSFYPARKEVLPTESEKVNEVVETLDTKMSTKERAKRPAKRSKPHTPRDPPTVDPKASAKANAIERRTKSSKSTTCRDSKDQQPKKKQSRRRTPRSLGDGEGRIYKDDPGVDPYSREFHYGPLGGEHIHY
ncbi:hypothetical protein EMPS_10732 [Entomortierella parvispora]|uniref:F-box domain-containing protein n=1 Tax=Entomortierella parvispora TaxID=205924 RepID=A0A9P3HKW4_9FUNG|nr:hypothetical protein EMPS_10732 [Entomortierella parvispora]